MTLVTVSLFITSIIAFYYIARYTYNLIKLHYTCSLLTRAQARDVGRIIAEEIDLPYKKRRKDL